MSNNTEWNTKSLRDFWVSDKLANIKPASWGEFPEGFDSRKVLTNIYQWTGGGRLIELGCGYGRLCNAFPLEDYLGLDVNPAAIAKARELFSNYKFDVIESPEALPSGEILLAYTVFLHMPDEILIKWISVMTKRYQHIVVCELLGRDWRKTAGTTPVFNRDLKDYVELLAPFTLEAGIRMPYLRYVNSNFSTQVASTDISFLVFGREGARLDGLIVTEQ
jgi:SAM-dependent methyltransferase